MSTATQPHATRAAADQRDEWEPCDCEWAKKNNCPHAAEKPGLIAQFWGAENDGLNMVWPY